MPRVPVKVAAPDQMKPIVPGMRLGKTSEGRPIIVNDKGGLSTEYTATVRLPDGQFLNLPTIYGGQFVKEPDDALVARVRAAEGGFVDPETGRALPTFPSESAAVEAAKARTKSLDSDPNIQSAFEQLRLMQEAADKAGRRSMIEGLVKGAQ